MKTKNNQLKERKEMIEKRKLLSGQSRYRVRIVNNKLEIKEYSGKMLGIFTLKESEYFI